MPSNEDAASEENPEIEVTDEAADENYADHGWYTDKPHCEDPDYIIKAARRIGPEIYRFNASIDQFEQVFGRIYSSRDLSDIYGDKASATDWFTRPAEIEQLKSEIAD